MTTLGNRKWSQLDAAAAITGTETTSFVQGGVNVRSTVAAPLVAGLPGSFSTFAATTGNFTTLAATTGNFTTLNATNGGTLAGSWLGLGQTVVGHTAALAIAGANSPNLQVLGTDAATAGLGIGVFSATGSVAAGLDFYKSANAAIGSATVVASGDRLGQIGFYGAQQTGTFATKSQAVQIRVEVDGTVTSGAAADMPGRLILATSADGSGTPTDRLILDSAGVLKPASDGGVTLGTTALGFQTFHFNTGGILNFENGDVTVTHSANTLAFAGASTGYTFDAGIKLGGAASPTPTVEGEMWWDTDGDFLVIGNGSTQTNIAPLINGTLTATTSGTSIDFTGIPAGVKKITVSFNQVSTDGASPVQVQIGDSGGVETSGYNGGLWTNSAVASVTTGFQVVGGAATVTRSGALILTLMDAATNLWSCNGTLIDNATPSGGATSGTKALSATLDRVRITTVSGTGNFDAGSANVQYEF